jgi:hypothetical protein
MATKAALPEDKITDRGEPVERGYAEWKRDKVIHGLEQAQKRDSMISDIHVWRNLVHER